jgi:hypothetical protein
MVPWTAGRVRVRSPARAGGDAAHRCCALFRMRRSRAEPALLWAEIAFVDGLAAQRLLRQGRHSPESATAVCSFQYSVSPYEGVLGRGLRIAIFVPLQEPGPQSPSHTSGRGASPNLPLRTLIHAGKVALWCNWSGFPQARTQPVLSRRLRQGPIGVHRWLDSRRRRQTNSAAAGRVPIVWGCPRRKVTPYDCAALSGSRSHPNTLRPP